MTPDQRRRMDDLATKYRFCFIVDGKFHSRQNERRMEKFVIDKRPEKYEFIRLTADITYVFWNPHPDHKEHI